MRKTTSGVGVGKYFAAVAVPVFLLAFLASLQWVRLEQAIEMAELELEGMEHVRHLQRAVVALQKVRGLSQMVPKGDSRLLTAHREFEEALGTIFESPSTSRFSIGPELEGVRETVRDLVTGRISPEPAYLFHAYTVLIAEKHALVRDVAAQSRLVLDGELDTYFLMDLAVERLPMLMESIGRTRAIGAGALNDDRAVSDADGLLLGERLGAVFFAMEHVRHAVAMIHQQSPRLIATLEPALSQVSSSVEAFGKTTRHLLQYVSGVSASDYFQQGSNTILETLALYGLTVELFEARLGERIDQLNRQRIQVFIASVVGLVLIVYFVASFYRQNRRAFEEINRQAETLGREVVERTAAEEALRASDARWRSLVENAPDTVLTVDPTWIITFANRRLPSHEMTETGRYLLDYVPPATRPQVIALMQQVFESGQPAAFEMDYPGESGRRLWYAARIGAVKEGEAVKALTVIARDITDSKEAEEQLRENSRRLMEKTRHLNRVNDELRQFAYAASHDLKAPLRAVHSLASCIQEDLGEGLSASVRGQLQLLQGRVRRMHDFIDGLLEYSAGGPRGGVEQVDPRRLVSEVLASLDIPEGFRVQFAEAQWPSLQADPLQLERVFANLITNAIHHHHSPRGTVTLSARVQGMTVEFAVADDGPGIPPQHHEKIFEVFQTLRRRDETERTGIGLAVVKKLVEEAGGRISVASAPGRGATFRFTWPCDLDYHVNSRAEGYG